MNHKQQIAIDTILECKDAFIIPPRKNWPIYFFQRAAYKSWAIEEVIERIVFNSRDDPIDIIYDFKLQLEHFADNSNSLEQQFIFETALEIIEDIGLLFV